MSNLESLNTGGEDASYLHNCSLEYTEFPENIDGYGSAIDGCYEKLDGSLWVGNCEYGSRVNFCPFCGFKAKKQIASP